MLKRSFRVSKHRVGDLFPGPIYESCVSARTPGIPRLWLGMTIDGSAEATILMRQTHIRHSEPRTRNPEASMLRDHNSCSVLSSETLRAAATRAGMTPAR